MEYILRALNWDFSVGQQLNWNFFLVDIIFFSLRKTDVCENVKELSYWKIGHYWFECRNCSNFKNANHLSLDVPYYWIVSAESFMETPVANYQCTNCTLWSFEYMEIHEQNHQRTSEAFQSIYWVGSRSHANINSVSVRQSLWAIQLVALNQRKVETC